GEIPNQFAADAYDGMYIIKQAAETAGITPDMDFSEICDAMKAAMTEISFSGITGDITWTADGEPTKDPIAVVIKDGIYEIME
ncbi:MAG: amino acid ABC transporter substrate-binding protein, partial [Blautia sp.]|nr:amino acid ABC transporter substrate-binding protein [Blautia sp.]